MGKVTEKTVVSMTPKTVEIDIDKISKHEMDAICSCLIRCVTKAFQNPQFAAEYEVWLAARRTKGIMR